MESSEDVSTSVRPVLTPRRKKQGAIPSIADGESVAPVPSIADGKDVATIPMSTSVRPALTPRSKKQGSVPLIADGKHVAPVPSIAEDKNVAPVLTEKQFRFRIVLTAKRDIAATVSVQAEYDDASMKHSISNEDFDSVMSEINTLLLPWAKAIDQGIQQQQNESCSNCCLLKFSCRCMIGCLWKNNIVGKHVDKTKASVITSLKDYFTSLNEAQDAKAEWTWIEELPGLREVGMTISVPVTPPQGVCIEFPVNLNKEGKSTTISVEATYNRAAMQPYISTEAFETIISHINYSLLPLEMHAKNLRTALYAMKIIKKQQAFLKKYETVMKVISLALKIASLVTGQEMDFEIPDIAEVLLEALDIDEPDKLLNGKTDVHATLRRVAVMLRRVGAFNVSMGSCFDKYFASLNTAKGARVKWSWSSVSKLQDTLFDNFEDKTMSVGTITMTLIETSSHVTSKRGAPVRSAVTMVKKQPIVMQSHTNDLKEGKLVEEDGIRFPIKSASTFSRIFGAFTSGITIKERPLFSIPSSLSSAVTLQAEYDPPLMERHISNEEFNFVVSQINTLLALRARALEDGTKAELSQFRTNYLLCTDNKCCAASLLGGDVSRVERHVDTMSVSVNNSFKRYFEDLNAVPGARTRWTWVSEEDAVFMTLLPLENKPKARAVPVQSDGDDQEPSQDSRRSLPRQTWGISPTSEPNP
eukprot:CAMPEP_0184653748 /NCGR_PEP_ID=MMETSP0308-20130426/11468_1 /TAXON_ID=38269 /ORGANISM="Gloeochaete witrockiana, Strain SAG 46.84" /LENGTH=699 /DNA_ID=CAMNT_0027089379 /DNA_START=168 /DNA_END=2267 /DNA_ORIENTATION=+